MKPKKTLKLSGKMVTIPIAVQRVEHLPENADLDERFGYVVARTVPAGGVQHIHNVKVYELSTGPSKPGRYIGMVELYNYNERNRQIEWTEEEAKDIGRDLARRYLKQQAKHCPNDTDGDGDCHLCYKTGGCKHRTP